MIVCGKSIAKVNSIKAEFETFDLFGGKWRIPQKEFSLLTKLIGTMKY
jgi:hypothetical protein